MAGSEDYAGVDLSDFDAIKAIAKKYGAKLDPVVKYTRGKGFVPDGKGGFTPSAPRRVKIAFDPTSSSPPVDAPTVDTALAKIRAYSPDTVQGYTRGNLLSGSYNVVGKGRKGIWCWGTM